MEREAPEDLLIAFFDVETTMPFQPGERRALLEFGAILVCPGGLRQVGRPYSTLICPSDLGSIPASIFPAGITRESITGARPFREVADMVFNILDGRIWAGHNIVKFDWPRIREAFAEIGRSPPEPRGTIDTLTLLTQKFGYRAGDMRMASLANHFGLGQQTHRSLDDVQLNLDVVKCCSTVLFLESSLPSILPEGFSSHTGFLEPDEVSEGSISATQDTLGNGGRRIVLLHRYGLLQLRCLGLKVRFGVNRRFVPKLNIVVDIPANLCQVLDRCDQLAKWSTKDSGSSSDWQPLIRKYDDSDTPSVQLHILPTANSNGDTYSVEIDEREPSGDIQLLEIRRLDAEVLEQLFNPGDIIDAYFAFDSYDYRQNAGIRLVAKRFIVHCCGRRLISKKKPCIDTE